MAVPGTPSIAPAVVIDGVSKTFTMPHERTHTLKERVLHPLRRAGSERFTALEDVDLPHTLSIERTAELAPEGRA